MRGAAPPGYSGLALFSDVVSLAPRDVWAVGANITDAPSSVLIEHWDGSAWRVYPVSVGYGKLVSIARVPHTTHLWAVGGFLGDKQLAAFWDGARWTFMRLPVPPSATFSMGVNAVAPVADDDVWAVGSDSDLDVISSPGRTFASHWDGRIWTIVPTPTFGRYDSPALLGATSVPGSTQAWAVGFVSHNDGSETTLTEWYIAGRWRVVPSPHPGADSFLTDVVARGGRDVWAVGTWFDGTQSRALVEHYSNGRWRVERLPNVPDGPYDALFGVTRVPRASSDRLWAVGTATATGAAASRTLALRRR